MTRPIPPLRRLSVPRVDDPDTQRAIQQIVDAVNHLEESVFSRSRIITEVSLVSGLNPVEHGLGRIPQGVIATPSQASAILYDAGKEQAHTSRILYVRSTTTTTANLLVF